MDKFNDVNITLNGNINITGSQKQLQMNIYSNNIQLKIKNTQQKIFIYQAL